MKKTKKEMKTEAIRRLKMFKYYPPSINDFKYRDIIMVNSPPLGGHFWLSDDEQKIIDEFQEKNDGLPYAVIESFTDFGHLYNILYVESDDEDWNYFNEDLKNGMTFAYVHNCDMPDCSEFGSISVAPTPAAGIKRIE